MSAIQADEVAATTSVPRSTVRSDLSAAESFATARARVALALLAIEGVVAVSLAATGLAIYKIAQLFT